MLWREAGDFGGAIDPTDPGEYVRHTGAQAINGNRLALEATIARHLPALEVGPAAHRTRWLAEVPAFRRKANVKRQAAIAGGRNLPEHGKLRMCRFVNLKIGGTNFMRGRLHGHGKKHGEKEQQPPHGDGPPPAETGSTVTL